MKSVWEKLNLKDHKEIMVLHAPESFEEAISELQGVKVVRETGGSESVKFFLFFVTQKEAVARIASDVVAQTTGDVIVWFSYPKGTSKKYTCDFNRDNGWDALFDIGFTGVRQIAIDEDWSSLRFRRREFVKPKK